MGSGDSIDSNALSDIVLQLAVIDRELDDAARIELISVLEETKAACAAAQAKITADLDASRRRERAEAGIPAAHRGRGIAAEIALARKDSPHRGGRHLGFATALVHEMPHTLALLERGVLSEWRATLLVRETACLTRDNRSLIDKCLCADPAVLAGLGDRELTAEARRLAAQVEVQAVVERARRAESERRVTTRPAPDTMAYLTALLPVREAITVQATLGRDADSLVAAGDGRTRTQLMADLLVQRVTGQDTATRMPVTVNLIISDDALLGDGTDPAHVTGYGPIPAAIARAWIADQEGVVELRRVYANPGTGALTALESQARCFPAGLARAIDVQDRTCRTPWCDAPIRHNDHVQPHDHGGPTSFANAAGLCQACNHAKQAEGWTTRPDPIPPGELRSYVITTPTGHRYRSTAPPLPLPAELIHVRDRAREFAP